MEDDASRNIITGEAESQGAVLGLWGGNDDGVSGSTSTYTARGGSRSEAGLGDHGPRQRAINLQNIFSNCWGGGRGTVLSRDVRDGR